MPSSCQSTRHLTVLLCYSQLEDRKTENELVCSSYRSKIQELWERLQVPQEEREGMSDHMVQSRKKNMDAVSIFFKMFLFPVSHSYGTLLVFYI